MPLSPTQGAEVCACRRPMAALKTLFLDRRKCPEGSSTGRVAVLPATRQFGASLDAGFSTGSHPARHRDASLMAGGHVTPDGALERSLDRRPQRCP